MYLRLLILWKALIYADPVRFSESANLMTSIVPILALLYTMLSLVVNWIWWRISWWSGSNITFLDLWSAIILTRDCSFSSPILSILFFYGWDISASNTLGSSYWWTFKKRRRLQRFPNWFWIGVPVIHHWCSASKAKMDFAFAIWLEQIIWAAQCLIAGHYSFFTLRTVKYRALCWKLESLALSKITQYQYVEKRLFASFPYHWSLWSFLSRDTEL